MLQRVLTLMYKEFLAVWRDKKSRMVLIVPPLIQLFIFSLAATLDVKNVPIGIVNRDNGEKGFELVQRFHGSPTFNHIVYLDSVKEITPFIDNQRGVMVVSIDEQFSRNLDAHKPADVQLILDGRKSNTAQIVAGYTANIVQQFNHDITNKTSAYQQNTQLFPRNWYNPNLIYYWFNVPNLSGILTMLVALIVTALSVARERELGTFDQLLVSPLSPTEIIFGKAIPAILISMAEASIIILAAILVFQIPFHGSILLLYLSIFVFSSAIVGVGLFISSLCSTQQQAILGTFVFMSPSVLLSGFATPIENMPYWLQPLTYTIPLRYFLVIAKGIMLKGMPFSIVFSNIWPMALIACFTLVAAGWLFRRRLE
ncbi:MAG: ABC transporter permease [Parachlamydiaceae bacterium]|nr:ABC transporter permease [Parachlamydiaceae bacterium]